MSAVLPIQSYRTEIVEITQSVFDTMLGTIVMPAGENVGLTAKALTAAVYFAGDWKGALLIECSFQQAIEWTSRLLSLPPSAAVDDDVKDGLGELVNVIAGNLKPILPPGVALSIPSVVEGSDYSLRICHGNPFERLTFEDSNGPFGITLVEVIS